MIRRATKDDFDAIVPGLIAFHQEVGVAPIDPESVASVLVHLLVSEHVFIALAGENVIGALGLFEQKIWYSTARRLVNTFFFVRPQYRGLTVGGDLLAEAKRLAEERGSLLEIDVINSGRRRGRVAEKFGFVPVGYLASLGTNTDVPVRQQRVEDDIVDVAR